MTAIPRGQETRAGKQSVKKQGHDKQTENQHEQKMIQLTHEK